jgi:HD-GYP domain-containing protein (c-di-GMP phosphodiesterase class II)
MALRGSGRGGHLTSRGSQIDDSIMVEERMPRQDSEVQPALKPAMLAELRVLSRAMRRLWCVLKVAPLTLAPGHENHSQQVARFSLRIARALKCSDQQCQRIYRAAYLHDVGSIAVPPPILRKSGTLTAPERAAMQIHPLISRELLGAFLPTADLAGIALSHHERYDGGGYPHGLQGTKIPVEARVLAVADSLDAMLSRRPYREKLSSTVARDELTREAGRQFDPGIVEALVRAGGW